MSGPVPSATSPTGGLARLSSPERAALYCHQLGLPGLVWLDSAVADPSARSLVAACPREIVSGEPGDWEHFDGKLRAFQKIYPGGAVVGWIEYEGKFQFGFYPRPLLFEHGSSRWLAPGGVPSWLDAYDEEGIQQPPWEKRLDFHSELRTSQYCRWVETAQAHIAAGDIYQVNLAHRMSAPWPVDGNALSLYLALRRVSPAPQAAFLSLDETRTVLCSSPEEFLTFSGRRVCTRPIKGTRPRGSSPAEDAAIARELLESTKERAELLMITDLLRNDLGQFCDYGSVRVRELFRVESFAQVLHLVSTVEGQLCAGITHVQALQMCLPGGSITGAPKRRAREIIAKLERSPRGLYTGSIGAFLGGGESKFNIAIRTLLIERGTAHFHVGSGIVADSEPQREWEETLHKASGILRAANSPST